MENRKVIVVGAGIGGLGAGYWASKLGYDVEILEVNDYPGGRIAAIEHRGDKVDVGAVFYHSDYKLAYELIDAMNLTKNLKKVDGLIQFRLKNGETYDYDHRIPYLRLLGPMGNLKVALFMLKYIVFGKKFRKYWIEKDIPEYDNRWVNDLFKGMGSQKINDYMVGFVAMGENAGIADHMSLYHFIHLFRLTTFTNWIGLTNGTAALPIALAKTMKVRYEAPVKQVIVEKGRVTGVLMEGSNEVKKAGHVIMAADAAAAARMMPDELRKQGDFLGNIMHSPLPSVVLFLDRPLKKDVWVYFNDIKQRRDYMVCIDQLAKMPEMVPSGKSILWLAPGHPKTLRLKNLSDDEIIKIAIRDAEEMVPGVGKMVEHTEIFRHPFGVPQFPAGAYKQLIDFREEIQKLRGISFVADIFGGHYMEASLMSAKDAVDRLCRWGGCTGCEDDGLSD